MLSVFLYSLWFIHTANSVLLLPRCPFRGGTALTPPLHLCKAYTYRWLGTTEAQQGCTEQAV